MEIRNELIDTMMSLKTHEMGNLKERFERNVDTENMPSWNNIWKAYQIYRMLENKSL